MKTICLMPVKNENWILKTTIPVLEMFCDHIIIADQHSTDGTRDFLKSRGKIEVIDNDSDGHSNAVRWKLLDYCREKYGSHNLIICIDADEMLPPVFFKKFIEQSKQIKPGTCIQAPWVQLWRSVFTYRLDNSVWSPRTNIKPFAFVDNGQMDYNRSFVINDHTSRIPNSLMPAVSLKAPLLHFQFSNWNRAQAKQAWYRCKELVNGGNAQQINQKYYITKDEKGIQYAVVDKSWYSDVIIDPSIENGPFDWYINEINEMFSKYGKEYFKDLDIEL